MSDNYWDEDDFNEEQPSGGKLRKQLEDALARIKTAESERAKLETELNGLKATRTLESKGLPPKAAKYMQADGVDVTDEAAVNQWLEDNSDVFNFSGTATPNPEQQEPDPQEPDVDSSGFERLAQIRTGAEPAPNLSAGEEVLNGLPDDASVEDIFKALAARGF